MPVILIRDIHLSRLADTDVIFRFPSKLQEQRLDKVRCCFPGFGSLFLESISVFVLDVQVKQMDFSEETLFWI